MARTEKQKPSAEDHPLRRFVLDEIHARPLAPVSAPRRVLHLACSTEEGAADAGRAALAAFASQRGGPPPAADARHHTLTLPEGRLRWERHTEFATYSWDMDLPGAPGWASAPIMLPQGAPQLAGPRVVAAELLLIKGGEAPWQDADTVTWGFDAPSLCVADVEQGQATIVTDFRPWPDGLTRILILDRGLTPQNAGALVQRLIEIETYRAFALMALPVVLEAGPELAEMEEALVVLLAASGEPDGGGHRALLDKLNDLAIGLERQLAATSYRIGASKAYEEILSDRLAAIGETPQQGQGTWSAFLNRRLGPALRTCASLGERQDRLSQRLVRAAALLRTRVEIALEDQNNAVLRAMNRRSQLQLRLQHTVEGLSIAAVSYYVVGLVSYLAKGGQVLGLPVPPAVIAALSVPLVIAWVAWFVRRIRQRSLKDAAD
ncbi:Uncharacterized membrane-anchored protein [hydrothermal vent metagenome]|uniref:Uncharacterized membrane-anchored protein n=1 Tax=hydrothermal vent metagenome TaxID=652676 RepID=A0A3B0TM05_9ZZZZ